MGNIKSIKKSFLSLALCLILTLAPSLQAKADSGSSFNGGTIKAGTADYGVVDGAKNDKFYHLTPGKASIYVNTCTGPGYFKVSLRKGYFSASAVVIDTVTVTKTGWYTFNDLPSDSKYYSLYISYHGASGTSGKISGEVHDHRA